tara:strand:+ start:10439 stop:11761 length:1323 start_codon:yes stop_codon:yes gene_type:complete
MAGLIKIYKQGCSVTINTTATCVVTATGTVHRFTNNPQIKIGQKIVVASTNYFVTNVVDEVYSGTRRSKVTFGASVSISNNDNITFISTDNTFNTGGRVNETSTFNIVVERIAGRILSPNPVINFDDVHSINNYRVVTTDVYENTTELIKRTFVITHKAGLRKTKGTDTINVTADTIVDLTGTQNKIYGYELLVKPPGENIEEITNKKASSFVDLTSISFPSKRNINKKAETRLLIVYGDPNATFKLGVVSNTISVNHESSAVTNQTTLNLSNSANAGPINKGMTIVSMGNTTPVTEGVKVVSKTDASPDTVTLNLGQSAASAELIGFAHVLVASNSVKTIDSNGIYYIYLKFPKNNSTANLTFAITLTENVADTFTEFSSPAVVNVVSLASEQAAQAYVSHTTRSVQSFQQVSVGSPASTGSGTTAAGQSAIDNNNLGA